MYKVTGLRDTREKITQPLSQCAYKREGKGRERGKMKMHPRVKPVLRVASDSSNIPGFLFFITKAKAKQEKKNLTRK